MIPQPAISRLGAATLCSVPPAPVAFLTEVSHGTFCRYLWKCLLKAGAGRVSTRAVPWPRCAAEQTGTHSQAAHLVPLQGRRSWAHGAGSGERVSDLDTEALASGHGSE